MNKIRVAYVPLTGMILAGKVTKDGLAWRPRASQSDVTEDAIAAVVMKLFNSKIAGVQVDGVAFKVSVERMS
jgi:hypothetical protein